MHESQVRRLRGMTNGTATVITVCDRSLGEVFGNYDEALTERYTGAKGVEVRVC